MRTSDLHVALAIGAIMAVLAGCSGSDGGSANTVAPDTGGQSFEQEDQHAHGDGSGQDGEQAQLEQLWSEVDQGRGAEVLGLLDEVEARRPLSAKEWTLRGFALGDQVQPEAAQAALERAEAMDPSLAQPVVEQCILAYNTDNHEEAVRHCTRALTIGPTPEYHAYLVRGLASLKLGRLDDAYESFQACKRLEPENAEAYYDESWVWAARGNLERTIEQIRLAGVRNPYYAQSITVGSDQPYHRFHGQPDWEEFIASLPRETTPRRISPLLLEQGPRSGAAPQ